MLFKKLRKKSNNNGNLELLKSYFDLVIEITGDDDYIKINYDVNIIATDAIINNEYKKYNQLQIPLISVYDTTYFIVLDKQTKYKTLYINISELNDYIVNTIIKKITVINNELNNGENK